MPVGSDERVALLGRKSESRAAAACAACRCASCRFRDGLSASAARCMTRVIWASVGSAVTDLAAYSSRAARRSPFPAGVGRGMRP